MQRPKRKEKEMFLLDGPRLPPVHASIKMNLKLFRKVKRRMLKCLGILTERAGEKVAQEAEEAKRAAVQEEFRRRIAERKKLRANCG